MSLQIYDERIPVIFGHSFLIADGTTPTALVVAGSYGARVDNALASNYAAADVEVILFVDVGAVHTALAVIKVVAGAGAAGVAPVDLIAALGTLAAGAIVLPASGTLYAAPTAAITADNSLVIITLGGNF